MTLRAISDCAAWRRVFHRVRYDIDQNLLYAHEIRIKIRRRRFRLHDDAAMDVLLLAHRHDDISELLEIFLVRRARRRDAHPARLNLRYVERVVHERHEKSSRQIYALYVFFERCSVVHVDQRKLREIAYRSCGRPYVVTEPRDEFIF